MKTKIITKKRISLWKAGVLITLSMLSVNANAEYFLVYGDPEFVSAPCASHHRVVSYHHYRHYRHYRHYVVYRRPSNYSITVYYPLPAYAWAPPPCCCCGETVETVNRVYVAPSYPAGVYYVKPEDRLVGNSWDSDPDYSYSSSQDTGTADNDVY